MNRASRVCGGLSALALASSMCVAAAPESPALDHVTDALRRLAAQVLVLARQSRGTPKMVRDAIDQMLIIAERVIRDANISTCLRALAPGANTESNVKFLDNPRIELRELISAEP